MDPSGRDESVLPTHIGSFEIRGVIGRGGMGVVYLGHDPELDRPVALKVLPDEFGRDPEQIGRLRREARLLASLSHPNIGAIWSLGQSEGGQYFLVLELIDGPTLRDRLRSGPMPLSESLRVGAQVAGALEAAHSRGIVHRDLKPDNIKLTGDGVVKVLDLGLAQRVRPTGSDAGEEGTATATLAIAAEGFAPPPGTVQGTPGYMSPEQVRGRPEDRRSDVFAFGAVLFECMAGRPAFPGESWMERIAATLQGQPPWSELPRDLPPVVGELLRLCLEKDPDRRPGTLTEVRTVLDAAGDARTVSFTPVEAPSGNLPRQLTSFVGRRRESAEIQELLGQTPLLTLTGVGGGGKTRLALHVAGELTATYPDGCWLVELGPVTDPNQVPSVVAHALQVREEPGKAVEDSLAASLRGRRLLLVLDNCEHVLEACGRLVELLLRSCSELRILATSREALGVPGETIVRIPSLSLQPGEKKGRCEAVQLFLDRARAAVPAFQLNEETEGVAARICARLDGIPLAIELAASRVRLLSLEEIVGKLDDRFRLLTGGSRTALERHQTLRAAIDWSYGLLSGEEKNLFRLLSVFAGGWTLDAALAVYGPSGDEFEVLDLVAHLVDKSLVMTEGAERIRYRFLETVRQFSAEMLDRTDDAPGARERHRGYFVRLAEEAEPKLRGPEQRIWLDRLEEDHENLLAALRWCGSSREGAECALRLASSVQAFWMARGHLAIGRSMLEEAASHPEAARYPQLQVRAITGVQSIAVAQGDWPGARKFATTSLDLAREVGDPAGEARAHNTLGIVSLRLGATDEARHHFEQSLSLLRSGGEEATVAAVLNNLGTIAMSRGEYEEARGRYEEARDYWNRLGHRLNLGVTLSNLGLVARRLGDAEASDRFYSEALQIHRELGHGQGTAQTLNLLGQAAFARRDFTTARKHWSEAMEVWKDLGNRQGTADILNNLGLVALEQDDRERARALFQAGLTLQQELGNAPREAVLLANLGLAWQLSGKLELAGDCYERSLEIRQRVGDIVEVVDLLENTAVLAAESGACREAAALSAAADAMRQARERPVSESELPRAKRLQGLMRSSLDPEALERCREEGRALSAEEAVRFAHTWLVSRRGPEDGGGQRPEPGNS